MKTLLIFLVLLFAYPMMGEASGRKCKGGSCKSSMWSASRSSKTKRLKNCHSFRSRLRKPVTTSNLPFAKTYNRSKNRHGLTR